MARKPDFIEKCAAVPGVLAQIMKRLDANCPRSIPVCLDRSRRMDGSTQLQTIEYLREENRVLREQLDER
jgi:hypothetical protein